MSSTITVRQVKTSVPSAPNLMLYFAIAYLSQGISCAQFGVIAQPISYFMMKGLNLTAAEISSYLALMMIPWVIKPVYGLLSDFIPLFGYRRKSYLITANAVSAVAFAVMFLTDSLPVILTALFVIALFMAVATALMVGLAVERGRQDGKSRDYFCVQEVGYYSANMLAALIGGLLCNYLAPAASFRSAAAIAVFPLIIISITSIFLLHEEKSQLNLSKLRQTWGSLMDALRSPALWIAGVFSLLWNFNPAMGVPLYFFESKTLCFSQASIGQLAAWNAGGMLLAAIVYPRLTRALSLKSQLFLAVALISVSSLSYLCLSSYTSAIVLELLRGTANMIAILSLYLLAAAACPSRTEVSVMAVLVALRNVGTNASTYVGGQLFTFVFHEHFYPLVIVAAFAPLISIFFLNLLPSFQQRQAVH